MTEEFCSAFYDACAGSDQLDLDPDYCDFHAGEPDEVWAYPLVLDGAHPRDTEDGGGTVIVVYLVENLSTIWGQPVFAARNRHKKST